MLKSKLPSDPAPGWYTAVADGGRWRRSMRPVTVMRSCGHGYTGARPADMPMLKVGDEISCGSACVPMHRGAPRVVRRVILVRAPGLPDCDPDCGDRADCDQAGNPGHAQCGMCPEDLLPRHHCGHLAGPRS